MKHKVYVVRDLKADFYAVPFYTQSHGMAVRMFADAVNDNTTMLYKHPQDFQLIHIAEFDDSNGTYENVPHVNVAIGTDVKHNNLINENMEAN